MNSNPYSQYEHLLRTDIEKLYAEGRALRRVTDSELNDCLDAVALHAGFSKGFAHLIEEYNHALQWAYTRMTLFGLYSSFPLAAQWSLRQLGNDLSQALTPICEDWEQYRQVFMDNLLDGHDSLDLPFHILGVLGQKGWYLLPGFGTQGQVIYAKDLHPIAPLVALIGDEFWKGHSLEPDKHGMTPMETAALQFQRGEGALLLQEDMIDSALEGSCADIDVDYPSRTYFDWAKPTPKNCFSAIVASLKLQQLREQADPEDDCLLKTRQRFLLPKAYHKAQRKYLRALASKSLQTAP